jgi:hypothetical protein
LEFIINAVVAALHQSGAHHPSFGAVSHVLGWVETKHWIIRICKIGTRGCHL